MASPEFTRENGAAVIKLVFNWENGLWLWQPSSKEVWKGHFASAKVLKGIKIKFSGKWCRQQSNHCDTHKCAKCTLKWWWRCRAHIFIRFVLRHCFPIKHKHKICDAQCPLIANDAITSIGRKCKFLYIFWIAVNGTQWAAAYFHIKIQNLGFSVWVCPNLKTFCLAFPFPRLCCTFDWICPNLASLFGLLFCVPCP